MSELTDQLRLHVASLSARTAARMYENPFWNARFGERGRAHAEADIGYHVEHLAEAIDWEMPSVMLRYARWLQPILVTRGMCSRHLEDTFSVLATAIQEQGIPGAGTAAEYLRAGQEALRYLSGPAREIQDAAVEIAERATERLLDRHPEWDALSSSRSRCQDDLLYHLSYLADALALDRPDLLGDYLTWVAGFLAGFDVPAADLHDALDELARAIGERLPDSGPVLELLADARRPRWE